MTVAITGIATLCAAGRGTAPLLRLLQGGGHALHAATPYPSEGLLNPRAGFVDDLDRERPAEALLEAVVADGLAAAGVDPARTGLVVGTSSGNVSGPWERWHRALLAGDAADEEGTGRDVPTARVAERLGLGGPTATLSVACASGTAALAVAAGWLDEGVDAVVVAGVDALSLFVHAGFSGLGALCAELPQPFRATRDGLALGEGAAALVLEPLERAEARGAPVLARLLGVGLSCDARHMTAPHQEGRGVADAMRAALADAGLPPDAVDTLSLHGTGTVYNDAMEAHALRAVFGDRPLAVHGIKHAIGHTLGAAGALEAAVVVEALREGTRPPAPAEVDPSLPLPVPPAEPPPPRVALSTSSAFGGINAAVVLAREGTTPERPLLEVVVAADVEVELGSDDDLRALWPDATGRALRTDRYCRVALWAVARALEQAGSVPAATGIVLSTRQGCRIADLQHHERIVEEGAGRASRLAFTYTVASAPACEAAIQHTLRGPLLTFIGAPDVATAEATRLLRRGHAPCMIALSCDAPSPDGPATARARVLLPRT